ncbi:hypothetical protein PENSPDRAFT_732928 [Peniophora sp. CONT]|nr:hypothetical protein PENSPDRAFT_732928 [Peniophora sp. CONT]
MRRAPNMMYDKTAQFQRAPRRRWGWRHHFTRNIRGLHSRRVDRTTFTKRTGPDDT